MLGKREKTIRKKVVALVASALLGVSVSAARANDRFVQWLGDFHHEAARQGISGETWNSAFLNITEPDVLVLEKAAYQPEFVQEIWDYLDTRVNQLTIQKGQAMADLHMPVLTLLENQYGVSRSILLAIWSLETNYGAVLKNRKRLHYIPQALATLAWGDKKRSKFARTQLIAALQILQAGDVARRDMLGSWAGAMGHTQFIPTSYLAYAVDMDKNGRRDIWNSVPDALATAANLLAKNGWRTGKTWGYEVVLTPGKGKYAEETKTLAEWSALGITRPDGKPFPRPEENAVLKVMAGEGGPGFLVMKNFYVLKRYNNSDKYALAVGMLADRLAGWEGLVQEWPRPKDSLSADEKIEIQRLLKDKGYYHGEIDGYLGNESKAAIRAFEKQVGIQVNGMPSKNVLDALRR